MFFAWAAAGICLIAAMRDLFWRQIDNSLVLLLLLLWGGFAMLRQSDLDFVWGHVESGLLVFFAMVVCYRFSWIGGGDVKLAAPVFLWSGIGHLLPILFIVAMTGLLLALLGVAERFLPKSVRRVLSPFSAERDVPYGVALAAGGLVAILAAMAEGQA